MDELDNILKKIIGKHAEALSSGGKDCLSENQFAGYLDNALSPGEKESVEKHLLQCMTCFRKSILFARAMEEMEHAGQVDVPGDLMERTKQLGRRRAGVAAAEVVLSFGKNVITIIKDSARICTVPGPVAFTARDSGKEETVHQVAKISTRFHGMKADISLEKINNTEFEIEARVSDAASGNPLDDIRINLVCGTKELASFLTENGSVLFRRVTFERYVLEMFKGREFLGAVPVTLMAAL
jgi:hypothetical protein